MRGKTGADREISVNTYTGGFTTMLNHHLRNRNLSLKAVGLLSKMLSLPPDWDYSIRGLAMLVFLERLLREKLGDDVARCFRECVAELKEEIQEQQELVKDYEGNADGYLDMCRDACESFTAIMELLEAPRLNRNALKSVTRNAFNAIYKNL